MAEAFVQGLEQNLAFFLVKSGWEAGLGFREGAIIATFLVPLELVYDPSYHVP